MVRVCGIGAFRGLLGTACACGMPDTRGREGEACACATLAAAERGVGRGFGWISGAGGRFGTGRDCGRAGTGGFTESGDACWPAGGGGGVMLGRLITGTDDGLATSGRAPVTGDGRS